MKNIVIILPTYNEKDNIKTLIASLEGVFKEQTQYTFRILVVDDESPDKTAEVVKKLTQKFKNITVISKQKEGLGAALMFGLRYGLKYFKPDYFLQIDADWQHNPLLIPDFLRKIETGSDFVVGSRYMKGGSIPGNWGLHRKIYSIVGNSIVRFGLGVFYPHDWTSGYRMYRKEVFEKVQDGMEQYSGYTFQVAFLHKTTQAGFKVGEVPLQFTDRVHGKSKIAPVNYITNLFMYIFNNSTFLKYLVIGVIGFSIQAIVSKILVQLEVMAGIAVGIGAFLAIVANFWGNNLWTFSYKKIAGAANLGKKFIHFVGTSIGAVIIQAVVVQIGVMIFGQDAWFILMIFAIGFLVIPYNYFIYNRFIWKK